MSELDQVIQGHLTGGDASFSSVSIDTRTLKQGDLFVAIKGDRFDGNEFVAEAEQSGAVGALVGRSATSLLPQFIAKDTRLGLTALAGEWRARVGIPLIGITGSNGKTTVKEMVASILGLASPILFTQGNLNNDIGVSLTLLGLQNEHQYAVVELGANHAGEIAYSGRSAKPNVAVITNAGSAHLAGFENVEGVARAKGELISALSEGGVAVLNADDKFIDLWKKLADKHRVTSFGFSSDADIRAFDAEFITRSGRLYSRFEVEIEKKAWSINLSLAGKHNVYNAMAAIAACLAVGIDMEQIQQGLSNVEPVPGRMQQFPGRLGSIIIDDTYNANPTSFEAALDVLTDMPGESWVILGQFGELGKASEELHARLGSMARNMGVKKLFATGQHGSWIVDAFGSDALFFEQQSDLIQAVRKMLCKDLTVLIKGSRSSHMETVVEALRDSGEIDNAA